MRKFILQQRGMGIYDANMMLLIFFNQLELAAHTLDKRKELHK